MTKINYNSAMSVFAKKILFNFFQELITIISINLKIAIIMSEWKSVFNDLKS